MLLERLLSDQCKISEKAAKPRDDDDDRDDGAAPMELKDPLAKEIKGDSLQTPHDPDATYSGHRPKELVADTTYSGATNAAEAMGKPMGLSCRLKKCLRK